MFLRFLGLFGECEVDYVQGLLNCCLKVHTQLLTDDADLCNLLATIKSTTKDHYAKNEEMLHQASVMIAEFTGVHMHSQTYTL